MNTSRLIPVLPSWLVASLMLTALGTLQGCGEDSTAPQPQAKIDTRVLLTDSVVSPGDTVVAIVEAANEGTASASLVFSCGRYLVASVENSAGDCLVACLVACVVGDSIPFELGPGKVLRQTFRLATVDWENRPLPPGLYAVSGGLFTRRAARVRAGFVIREP